VPDLHARAGNRPRWKLDEVTDGHFRSMKPPGFEPRAKLDDPEARVQIDQIDGKSHEPHVYAVAPGPGKLEQQPFAPLKLASEHQPHKAPPEGVRRLDLARQELSGGSIDQAHG